MARWQEWLANDSEAKADFAMWLRTQRRLATREMEDAVAKGKTGEAQVALGKKLLLDQLSSSTTMTDREESQYAHAMGRVRATRS